MGNNQPNNYAQFKGRLQDYLTLKGVEMDFKKKNPLARCINPSHADSNPSMSVYKEKFNCVGCGESGDIFDAVILMSGDPSKKNAYKSICESFGVEVETKTNGVKLVPLKREEAAKIYSKEAVLKYAIFLLNKDIEKESEEHRDLKLIKFFAYFNAENLIDTCVVRFEDQHKKKHVLTYYWNGTHLKMSGYKILIYGRNLLAEFPDKPVIIHEGEKCADIGNEKMPEFVHITWNGGGQKFSQADWKILKDRPGKVYLLPDDDQKAKSAISNELKPQNEQPGFKTMLELQKKLKKLEIDSINIGVFPEVRKIKADGADIEEILKVYTPEELTKKILSLKKDNITTTATETAKPITENKKEKDDGRTSKNSSEQDSIRKGSRKNSDEMDGDSVSSGSNDRCDSGNYPFQILGIADDGRAYFLNYENRLLSYELETLTDKKLIGLAGLQFFKNAHGGHPKSQDWITEIDEIMHISNKIDFNLENCRGRGAWKDPNGNICYHDGEKTTGKFDQDWTFLRKPKRKIGINSKECEAGTRSEIMKSAKKFSFATSADAVRLLSHAAISPFGGALTWRTAILVTGESGWGKSTIVDKVAKPISGTQKSYGGNSSEAGIRQHNANDSGSIYIDEAESKRPKDKERIEDLFDLMRSSTSDDSPVTAKGSISGKVSIFTMKSMFCFVSINASIDNAANDNRIIRVNFKKPENGTTYSDDLKSIKSILSKQNCDGIRAFVWKHLGKIIELGERLEIIIQEVTKQDARFAAGESILLATNLIVWENQTEFINDEELTNYIRKFYSTQTQEEKRDEITEMINRLLDETTITGERKEKRSLREMLVEMKKFLDHKHCEKTDQEFIVLDDKIIGSFEYLEYKKTVEQYGLTVYPKKRELAIAQNHNKIMSILQVGKGYQRQLERHKNVILSQHNITIDSGTKTCTVIGGFLNYTQEEEG